MIYRRNFSAALLAFMSLTMTASLINAKPHIGMRTAAKKNPVALEGYCAICLAYHDALNKGTEQFKADYDGKTYLFPNQGLAKMFVKSPSAYAPVLGGDDIVQFKKTGKRVMGSLTHHTIHAKRIYMFASAKSKKMFKANPKKFVNADIAFGGDCAVCKFHMHKNMPGKINIATTYNGLRYLFPSAKEQQAFTVNPVKYSVKTVAKKAMKK